MKNNIHGPHSEAPTRHFPGNNAPDPQAAATDTTFTLQLFNNGVSIGYMGLYVDHLGDNYCVLVTEASQALQLSLYNYGGVNYYSVNNGSYLTSYLTISDNSYVTLETWMNACGWTFEADGTLCCASNGQHLSLYSDDNGYLYSYDMYTVLTVQQSGA